MRLSVSTGSDPSWNPESLGAAIWSTPAVFVFEVQMPATILPTWFRTESRPGATHAHTSHRLGPGSLFPPSPRELVQGLTDPKCQLSPLAPATFWTQVKGSLPCRLPQLRPPEA